MALSARTLVFTCLGWTVLGAAVLGQLPGAPVEVPTSQPNPDTFSYERLAELAVDPKVRTLEQLLRKLPQEIRGSHILMEKSKSSHQATPFYPRVILCSPNAEFMMAYATAHTDPNRYSLEIIQWREKTETFEFREITFDPKGLRKPSFSTANPGQCIACHGDSPRPNWEPASIWPGAVGAGDKFTKAEVVRMKSMSNRNEGRLQALEWTPRFIDEKTPAFEMSEHLNVLNSKRITRFLRESPNYDLYKYAIVAGLLGLPEFQSIEPIRTASIERPDDYKKLLDNTRSTLTELLARYYSPDEGQAITNFRFIFEPRKISYRDVSTSNRSLFMLTGNMTKDFGAVVNQLYDADPELRAKAPLPPPGTLIFADQAARLALGKKLKEAADKAWEHHTGIVKVALAPAK